MPTASETTRKPQFAIEKDVPFVNHPAAAGFSKYPFAEMDVGDSFFVPGQTGHGTAASSARAQQIRLGKRFACRTVDGGVRIWRIA